MGKVSIFVCMWTIKISLNNKLKIFVSWNEFATLRGEKHKYVHHWEMFKINLWFFYFKKIWILT